jgi:hypothetical protein
VRGRVLGSAAARRRLHAARMDGGDKEKAGVSGKRSSFWRCLFLSR